MRRMEVRFQGDSANIRASARSERGLMWHLNGLGWLICTMICQQCRRTYSIEDIPDSAAGIVNGRCDFDSVLHGFGDIERRKRHSTEHEHGRLREVGS